MYITEAGQLCGSCKNVIQPKDCDTVMECGQHEVWSFYNFIHEWREMSGVMATKMGGVMVIKMGGVVAVKWGDCGY